MVVRGISATGLPTLPSGVIYSRGLGYSYAAWLVGALFEPSLPVFRGVSLAFAIGAVVLLACVGRLLTGGTAAVFASLLFAFSPLLLTAAAFARFYSAAVAMALLAVWVFVRPQKTNAHRGMFLVALLFCRLTHEFAVLLALLPLCRAACVTDTNSPDRPRSDLRLFIESVGLLGIVQLVLTGVSRSSIATHVGATSGDVRRPIPIPLTGE